jgi:glycosyltransferase involved in cell wall biosynthesis
MYGANELALLMGRAIGARVVWGVRASNVDVCQYNWTTRLLFKTGAWLSSRADLIIANSEAGRRYHIGLGYPSQRFIVIPNGIDTSAYHHEGGGRVSVRAEWGMGDTEVLVGIVARLDPMKDHETFIKAASLVADIAPRVRFVIIGADRQNRRVHLETLARDIGVEARIIWAGARSDMTSVYSALDLVTSSSAFGEGFSNSLGEAMACETICVATDVGDARAVIGDTGLVVPVRDAEALARAWFELLKDGSSEMSKRGQHARAHIVNNFGVAALAERTSQAIRSVIKKEC